MNTVHSSGDLGDDDPLNEMLKTGGKVNLRCSEKRVGTWN